jgi:hypothetical protein
MGWIAETADGNKPAPYGNLCRMNQRMNLPHRDKEAGDIQDKLTLHPPKQHPHGHEDKDARSLGMKNAL